MTAATATEATATLISVGGIVTLTTSNGLIFSTKDSNGFIGRLDKKLATYGWKRAGYETVGGVMTTTVTRSARRGAFDSRS